MPPKPPTTRPRMDAEQLQAAADHIRMGGLDYNPGTGKGRDGDWESITVTQGMDKNGQWVWTVTSSAASRNPERLTLPQGARAAAIFGTGGFVNPPDDCQKLKPRTHNDWHSEQRGIRATQGQVDRCQATSNITPDTKAHRGKLHVGAACPSCAAAQIAAGVTNVTGTVYTGRTNKPKTGAWTSWRAQWA